MRNILELSLEFSIIALMDITVHNWSTWGYILSFGLSVAAMVTLVAFIVSIRFHLRPKYAELKTKESRESIGALY